MTSGSGLAKRWARGALSRPAANRLLTAVLRPVAPRLSDVTLSRLPLTRTVTFNAPGTSTELRLASYGIDPIAALIFWRGISAWEPETVPVFTALAQSSTNVLDIGANTGLFSVLAGVMVRKGSVHAVEPVPRVAERLRANVALNGLDNVVCHELALSDRSGSARIYVPPEDVPLMASLVPGWRAGTTALEVPTLSLDQLVDVAVTGRVDLLKLDAEGAEGTILRGGAETLRAHQPYVICEVLAHAGTPDSVVAALDGAGYLPYVLTGVGPRPAGEVVGNETGSCHNYLFVPRSRSAEARQLLNI